MRGLRLAHYRLLRHHPQNSDSLDTVPLRFLRRQSLTSPCSRLRTPHTTLSPGGIRNMGSTVAPQQTAEEAKQAGVQRLRSIMGDGLDQSRWSAAWTAKQTPWDSGGIPQPSLVSFMEDVEEGKALRQNSQRKRVLIPGCGTGYDVEYFARLGFKEARGADIAPEATKAAQAWVDSLSPRPERHDRIHLETMDYLALADARIEAESQYDLIYDYTFFCALPPSLRPKWAQAHANNLKAGEGMLITLCFPMQGDRPGGPPYSVSPELYKEHLLPHFDLQYQGVPPGQPESRKGIEAVMLWKRKV